MAALPLVDEWPPRVDFGDERAAVIYEVGEGPADKTTPEIAVESTKRQRYVEFYERCVRILSAFYRVFARNFPPYSPKKNHRR